MLNRTRLVVAAISGLAFLSLPLVAMAQEVPQDTDPGEATGDPAAAGEDSTPDDPEELPAAKSDNDPTPQAAAIMPPDGNFVRQAGVGGAVAYGRHGVLELGGSAGFTAATDFRQLSISPSVGWFLADNFQISAIFGLVNVNASSGGAMESSTLFSMLMEPSYHVPFNNTTFAFFGLGAGLGYVDGLGAGFAMVPRMGMNVMVGRSGILSPAAFFQYTTHEAVQTPQGTLLAVSSAYGAQLGYTVMW